MSTRIICQIVTCKHRGKEGEGICKHTTIQLQGCSPDADNVMVCSEYEEIEKEAENGAESEKAWVKKYSELQAVVEANRWIPVTERSPEEAIEIWAANPNGVIERWYWTDTLYEKNRLRRLFTHWKPIILPEQALTNEDGAKGEDESN